jgi:hypothetical protein
LIRIEKSKQPNPFTGDEIEIESPDVRKSTLTGTIRLADGNPILMPIEYRPTAKGKEDKVWLMVARPFIWIEEEVQERRQGGKEFTQRTVWESDVEEDEIEQKESVRPAKRLPLDDDTRGILQAIITDVLTNADLKHTRDFYGTARDKTIALVDTGKLGWPKDFCPVTH